jgi:hypothetical protein
MSGVQENTNNHQGQLWNGVPCAAHVGAFLPVHGRLRNPDLKPEKTKTPMSALSAVRDPGPPRADHLHMDITDRLVTTRGLHRRGLLCICSPPGRRRHDFIQPAQDLGSYSPKASSSDSGSLGYAGDRIGCLYLSGSPRFHIPDIASPLERRRHGFRAFGGNRVEAEVIYSQTGDGYFFDYESRPFDSFGIADARLTFIAADGIVFRSCQEPRRQGISALALCVAAGRTVSVSVETKF